MLHTYEKVLITGAPVMRMFTLDTANVTAQRRQPCASKNKIFAELIVFLP